MQTPNQTPRRSARLTQKTTPSVPSAPIKKKTTPSVPKYSEYKYSPFAHYAEQAEEADSDDIKPTTLIKSKTPITVQQLIDALQKAIEKDPSLATKQVRTVQDGCAEPAHEVTFEFNSIVIDSTLF